MQCKRCGNLVRGANNKFCSKGCYWESLAGIKGKNAPNYKKVVGKSQVHRWLYVHYGSPKICEMKGCKGKSQWFDWAKKTDYDYERNINNFLRLCRKCHRKYDLTPKKAKQAIKNLWWVRGIPVPNKRVGIVCKVCGGSYYSINLCKIHYEEKYRREKLGKKPRKFLGNRV